ncbi:hypothetical protein HDU79_003044 [Rhizoclosmatium sp. JEL0117]|nr:hypothetical protein HDU79_003044 [Rhizoclosmatium sp. JEL0117]
MFGFSGSLLLPGTNGVLGGGGEREREKEKPTVQWIPASPHSPLKSPLRHSRSPSVTRPTSPRQDWDVPEQKLGSPVSLVPSTGKPVRPFSDYVDQFNIFPDPALYEDAPISEAAKPTVFSPAPRSITPRLGLRVFNSNTSLNGGGSNTAASISSVGRDAGQLIARKLTWIKDFFFRQQPSAAPIQEFGIPRSSSAPPNPQESLTVSPPSVPSLALDTTAKQFDHEDTTPQSAPIPQRSLYPPPSLETFASISSPRTRSRITSPTPTELGSFFSFTPGPDELQTRHQLLSSPSPPNLLSTVPMILFPPPTTSATPPPPRALYSPASTTPPTPSATSPTPTSHLPRPNLVPFFRPESQSETSSLSSSVVQEQESWRRSFYVHGEDESGVEDETRTSLEVGEVLTRDKGASWLVDRGSSELGMREPVEVTTEVSVVEVGCIGSPGVEVGKSMAASLIGTPDA